MIVAIVCFSVAAVAGIIMGGMRIRGRELPPILLALLHGLLAASGLVALIVSLVMGTMAGVVIYIALCGFLFAAVGGFLLLSFHIRKKALPIPVVGLHGSLAVASFVVLVAALLVQA